MQPTLCCLSLYHLCYPGVETFKMCRFVPNFKSSSVMCPTLEGCLFSVAKAAKTDMKWPSCATDAEGGGRVYIYM